MGPLRGSTSAPALDSHRAGPQTATPRCNCGFAVGQDHGKGGLKGYDAGKRVNGRKRHILVDVLGLVLCVVVHPANIQDRDGARLLLQRLGRRFPKLKLLVADGAYAGELEHYVRTALPGQPLRLQIVKRSDRQAGFVVQPWRWVVERTFGWLGRYRRLSKDYEQRPQSSEAMILLAMIHLMSRRLAQGGAF